MKTSQAEGLQRLVHSLRGHSKRKKTLESCQIVYNHLMNSKSKHPASGKTQAPVSKKAKRKRGRLETRVVKIDASPEYVAKAIFAAGKINKK